MKPVLTIIITCWNDSDECGQTVESILGTAGEHAPEVEILIVDDGSNVPLKSAVGRVIRNEKRIGVGPSRHIGALAAKSDYLLIIDSHMRFTPGWFEAIAAKLPSPESTVYCGVCLGLGMTNKGVLNMDVNHPNAVYYGATWNLLGPDRNSPRNLQVFENIWAAEQPGDDYELSAVMGACYVVSRSWYLKLHCGQHLVSYGCDEAELSLKTILCGGTIRMMKGLRLGHKFKEQKRNNAMGGIPYNANNYVLRNKMMLMHTLLPSNLARILIEKLPRGADLTIAKRELEADWRHVEIERFYMRTIFKTDFSCFAGKFGVSSPAY